MKGIILAAGKGSRLYPLTLNKPKSLLAIGDETILGRLIRQLKSYGVKDILIVVGFQKNEIINYCKGLARFSFYEKFNETNNLHTLWSVKEEIDSEMIISFADLVLQDEVIEGLINSEKDLTLTVDSSQVLESTMKVRCEHNMIKNIKSTTEDEATGNFIGIAKFSQKGAKDLVNEMESLIGGNYDDYYTLAIDRMARRGKPIACFDVSKFFWREIDTLDEYYETNAALCNLEK